VERGERDIRIQTLCKLADVFDITLSELFKGTDGYK
jgi:transcriptional regulator with XRE-family HTH domain